MKVFLLSFEVLISCWFANFSRVQQKFALLRTQLRGRMYSQRSLSVSVKCCQPKQQLTTQEAATRGQLKLTTTRRESHLAHPNPTNRAGCAVLLRNQLHGVENFKTGKFSKCFLVFELEMCDVDKELPLLLVLYIICVELHALS